MISRNSAGHGFTFHPIPTYEFSCEECNGLIFVSSSTQPTTCPLGHVQIKRQWGFSFHRQWQGGYAPAIGRYAANDHDFDEGLKAASDYASENTGMEHNYRRLDTRDEGFRTTEE